MTFAKVLAHTLTPIHSHGHLYTHAPPTDPRIHTYTSTPCSYAPTHPCCLICVWKYEAPSRAHTTHMPYTPPTCTFARRGRGRHAVVYDSPAKTKPRTSVVMYCEGEAIGNGARLFCTWATVLSLKSCDDMTHMLAVEVCVDVHFLLGNCVTFRSVRS